MNLEELLGNYNPWWQGADQGFQDVPDFQRPVFRSITRDLLTQRQIISITGPRRVGKTTLLRQLVRFLILSQGRPPDQLIYYSLDDPALFRPGVDQGKLFESLIVELRKRAGRQKVWLFLDEIQRLDRWELHLKKYYDLNFPIRFVISGSASSPIFKKSRESLLGRVKDYHLLPFSFREFLLYNLQGNPDLLAEFDSVYDTGISLMGMLAGAPQHLDLQHVTLEPLSDSAWEIANGLFHRYIREGGFPEVWKMQTWDQKIDYLYDNQVKKVIYEDLVLAAEFRKPEQLKRFYLSLLEKPGQEVNFSTVASETGVGLQQVQKYLPLLEMTDLVNHVERFRKSPLRVRRGNVKFYLVDLALRNAVLRLRDDFTADPQIMGLYAENLVFNALHRWRGILALDYYRQRNREIDFVVHLRPQRYLPIEVKYQEAIPVSELDVILDFIRRFKASTGLIVGKNRGDFGSKNGLFYLPLQHFLLLFD